MTPFHPFFHMFFKPPSFKSTPFVHYLHKSFYPYLLLFISGMDGKVFSRSNKILVGFLTKIMSSVSLCFFFMLLPLFHFGFLFFFLACFFLMLFLCCFDALVFLTVFNQFATGSSFLISIDRSLGKVTSNTNYYSQVH